MPPSREKPPMMTKGKGNQTLPRVATGGATIPPIRPHRELAPTAVLLRSDGFRWNQLSSFDLALFQ